MTGAEDRFAAIADLADQMWYREDDLSALIRFSGLEVQPKCVYQQRLEADTGRFLSERVNHLEGDGDRQRNISLREAKRRLQLIHDAPSYEERYEIFTNLHRGDINPATYSHEYSRAGDLVTAAILSMVSAVLQETDRLFRELVGTEKGASGKT